MAWLTAAYVESVFRINRTTIKESEVGWRIMGMAKREYEARKLDLANLRLGLGNSGVKTVQVTDEEASVHFEFQIAGRSQAPVFRKPDLFA